jgi:aminomuconate-semialdehyde/2-hydroxymuconate-6-semialdehyde dehydrogenase
MLCQVLKNSGIPDGVVNMVFGTGLNVGMPLVLHPGVPAISFTGGTTTGKVIYRNAAEFNKKLSLELGGKNANLIFQDCNLAEAVKVSIRSSFLNQGEICLCGSRIFVHESIYDRFLYDFKLAADLMIVGDPLDENTQVGALVSAQHMEKVLSYIEIAKQEGGICLFLILLGTILTGGKSLFSTLNGYFMRPTIITGLHATDSRVQKEEIFGPVVTVTPFSTDEEAIKFANATEYGLSCSIWTQDITRAHTVAQKINVGTCWINTWMMRDLNVPFGGVKGSGLGREGRNCSDEFFLEAKTICVKL